MNFLVWGLLVSLTAPFFLLLIEYFLPYPYFLEEMVKLLIVKIILTEPKNLGRWVLTAGALFTLSESILYLVNIINLDVFSLFFKRLILTGPLHMGTMLLMYFLGKKGNQWLGAAFFLAVMGHILFNLAGF